MVVRSATPSRQETRHRIWPPHFFVGVTLVTAAWSVAWAGPAPFSEHTFFPLWLGYILTVDGLTVRRSGSSLLTRDRRRFAALFLYSVPLWWLFEAANAVLENWRYIMPREWSPLAYHALASLAFSTVIPALFVTAELYRTTPLGRPRRWLRIEPGRTGLLLIATAGLAMFAASLAFPRVAFPLVWLGLFFLFDPLNRLLGAPSIAAQVAGRRWDTVVVLFAAGLTCGFFWEMWNSGSMPKWVYDVPYVDRPRLFEMPLLGYGGYLPFALEVYAAYHLMRRLLGRTDAGWLRFDKLPSSAPDGGRRVARASAPSL